MLAVWSAARKERPSRKQGRVTTKSAQLETLLIATGQITVTSTLRLILSIYSPLGYLFIDLLYIKTIETLYCFPSLAN